MLCDTTALIGYSSSKGSRTASLHCGQIYRIANMLILFTESLSIVTSALPYHLTPPFLRCFQALVQGILSRIIASKDINAHNQSKGQVSGHGLYFVGMRKALPTSMPRILHNHKQDHSSFDKPPDPVPSDPARTDRHPSSLLLYATSSDKQCIIS